MVERIFPDGLYIPANDEGAATCLAVVERNAGDLRPLYQKGIEMPPLCEIRDRLRVTTGEATLEVMADEYSVDGALDDRREIERQ